MIVRVYVLAVSEAFAEEFSAGYKEMLPVSKWKTKDVILWLQAEDLLSVHTPVCCCLMGCIGLI